MKVLVGPARETLEAMQPSEPFDLVFIDADKDNNLYYFIEGKRMLRKGGVIVSLYTQRFIASVETLAKLTRTCTDR